MVRSLHCCLVALLALSSVYGQLEFAVAQSPPQPSPELIRFGSGEPVRAIKPHQFQIELPNISDPLSEERPKRHSHAGYVRHPTFQVPQQQPVQQFQPTGHVYVAQPNPTVVSQYPFQPAPVYRQYSLPQQFPQPTQQQFSPQQQQFVPQQRFQVPQQQFQLSQRTQHYIQPQLPPQPLQPQYPRFDLRPQPVRPVRPVYIVSTPAPRPAVRPGFYTERPQAAYGDDNEDTNFLNGRLNPSAPKSASVAPVTQGYSERPPPVTQVPYIEPKTAAPYIEPKTAAPYIEPKTAAPYIEPKTAAPYIEPKTAAPYIEPTTARPHPRPQPPRTRPYVHPTTRRPAPKPTTRRPVFTTTTPAYVEPQTTTPRPTPRSTTARRITTTTAAPTTTTTRATTTTTRAPTTTTTRKATQRTTTTPRPTTTTTRRTTTTTTTTTPRPTTTTTLRTTTTPRPTTTTTTAAPSYEEAVDTPHYDETFVGQYYYGRRGEGGNNTFPLPSCFYNPSGYVCCNLMLNELMTTSFEEVRVKTNLCNVHKFAHKLQRHSEKIFSTNFETIVSYQDFSQKIHFKKDLVCKVEIDGRFILAYATPEDVEQEKIIPTVPSREIQKDSVVLKEEVKQQIRIIEREL